VNLLAAWLRLALVALLLALAACGGKPKESPLPSGTKVLALGDSLTAPHGVQPQEAWPTLLAQKTGWNVINGGVSGNTSAQALERLPGLLEEHQPLLVLVGIGGNDMLRKQPQAAIESNLRAMLKEIRSRGIDAVLVGVPAPGLITSAPDFYAKLAQEFSIPYEGKVVTSVLYKPELKSDPIHPNADGYRRIAEALAKLLRDAGAV
jgi:lysophospholipase L1-like esterase